MVDAVFFTHGKEEPVLEYLRHRLFGLASRHIATEDPLFSSYGRAIVEMLDHRAFERIKLTEHKLNALDALSDYFVTRPADRRTANLVAIQRLRDEKRFDPMHLPTAMKLLRTDDGEKSNAAYRRLLDAFGLIAIAWQLSVYGTRLVITVDAYNRTVATRTSPPN